MLLCFQCFLMLFFVIVFCFHCMLDVKGHRLACCIGGSSVLDPDSDGFAFDLGPGCGIRICTQNPDPGSRCLTN
jgi:hypothetical protein